MILNFLDNEWKSEKQILMDLDVNDTWDIRYVRNKLKVLSQKGKVKNQIINQESFWRSN